MMIIKFKSNQVVQVKRERALITEQIRRTSLQLQQQSMKMKKDDWRS